ncbi:MAG TPA: DUF2845 domain-containing protein [Desulfobacterales bacterium]|jgi:hypothetical protein|nr:DUF2845 domain-containing protein [Desulfobacterales bacterium]HUT43222.1 DUF2845 domain-containing protein [Desulfobacterales bacterium]
MNKSAIKHKRLQGISLLLSIICVLFFQNDVAADSYLRCQGRLVSIGDTKEEVLDKCDHPDKRDQWEEDHNSTISQIYDYKTERYIAPKRIKQPIRMERWTYNMGTNKFIRYLNFQNGELIKIETGERGRD